jgi:hypothetical protein
VAPARTRAPDCGVTDSDRFDRLEREIAALRREIAELRAEREPPGERTLRGEPVLRRVPTSPPRPALVDDLTRRLHLDALPHDRADLEAVVGRYGTVAIAALLILMGVGAFLTWAIGVISIGPRLRVVLGVVLAAIVAAAGWRLRTRDAASGARRFGDVLLALALAVVHVDAWGAGPYLGLIPPGVALALAAAASAALALLAWSERDQALFVVGVGGALVAPFVTSAGPGHPYVLPIYGWLVLSSGALALPRAASPGTVSPGTASPRPWTIAARLLSLGTAAYAAAMLGDARALGGEAHGAALRGEVPALFAIACAAAVLPLAIDAASWIALAALTSALGAIVALALGATHGAPRLAFLAGVADVLAYAALWRATRDPARHGPITVARASITAVLLPLALLVAALIALPDALSNTGAALGGAWAALAIGAALLDHRPVRPLLGAHVVVAGLAGALVPTLLLRDDALARTAALAAHGALFALVFARVRRRGALAPPFIVLVAASLGADALLRERPAFAYPPFLTSASVVAAVVVAAWVVFAWQAWRVCRPDANDPTCPPLLSPVERGAVVGAAAVDALLWGREELARAGSPEISTFLLVGYFAAAGIAVIFAGRLRRVPAARQAGLALALYAAFKALLQASALDAVGLRVASYLVVGAFLLGVGYWYRVGGTPDERAAA